ncbi:uncharacterized protein LOC131679992 [Topomyia yanbarensis]|uniref:uncharacterized protein LOC131679992 n=1 Tax=Topomyia yanbarensis TaxID=2498891 RepID=UPI00273B2D8A|nr:uncharacterized protein LOC131679992 [Topomyia yanbarensis]
MAQNNGHMASSIEPYRKGTSFSDWADRLEFTFLANEVSEVQRKSRFMNLCGPYVYSQLKLVFQNGTLTTVGYTEMINKLKQRFDRTEPDLVQRYRFSHRVQQPDESAEDFVLAVKLQAEFCGFGAFKEIAIQDRVLAGLRDEALKQRLLNEENLTLESMDKFITTWNIAKSNAKTLNSELQIPPGSQLHHLLSVYSKAQSLNTNATPEKQSFVKRPVRERLGFQPYTKHNTQSHNNMRHYQDYNQRTRKPGENSNNYHNKNRRRPDYSQIICDFCGVKGHMKKKCFRLKNMKRDAVKFVDTAKPGTSAEKQLSTLMDRMTTKLNDDDSDDDRNSGELQCMCVTSLNKISEPCLINVSIDNCLVKMEVDSGSTVSVMGKNQYFYLYKKPLSKCNKQLLVVNGSKLKIEGETNVLVSLNGRETKLNLLILDTDFKFMPLLGRNWLDIYFPQWRQIFSNNLIINENVNNVNTPNGENLVEEMKNEYATVFIKDFTTPIKGFEADLVLKSEAPIFKKAYDGASSSASIFQHIMEQILEGIEGVFVYLDDVLIAGKDLEDCRRKLILVLKRLANANIKGIKVLKSPPYNPSSNGQAERLVRTTKDVLKKFLLEPELVDIGLEDQINLFLMNYRNNIVTSHGQFPSEKIMVGSATAMAHRTQLKSWTRHELLSRPNVRIKPGARENHPTEESEAGYGSEDEPFRGFSEVREKARKLKRDADEANLPNVSLRRSKRIRVQNMDTDYIYKLKARKRKRDADEVNLPNVSLRRSKRIRVQNMDSDYIFKIRFKKFTSLK